MVLRERKMLGLIGTFPFALHPFLQPAPPEPHKKRVIYYGWGMRDTIFIRHNWREMERMPFDGTGIVVALDRRAWLEGKTGTGNRLNWQVFGPRALKLEDFEEAISDLKAAKWERFTENFIPASICSQGQDFGFDWFDDKRWRVVVDNWRVLVTIAKEGGCRGVIIDPEHYGAYFFNYAEMRKRTPKPFHEFVAKVRERGMELMAEGRKIFPGLVVFLLFGPSILALSPEPVERQAYGLLPAFLDGMLLGSDEETVFVDGCEFSYGYKERHQFLEAYHTVMGKALRFTSVPRIYRAKVRVGFGLWLDCRWGGKGWDTENFHKNYFSPEEFERSLGAALEVSEGYVWIYSQAPRFFPPENLPQPYLQAIERARGGGA